MYICQSYFLIVLTNSPDEATIVAPVEETYPMKGGVTVCPLHEMLDRLHKENE